MKEYIGLTKKEAIAKAKKEKKEYRTVREDDKRYMVTTDFHPERLNFTIKEGIITGVEGG